MHLKPIFLIFSKPRGILYFIVEHTLVKSNIRYPLVVCLHFIPPNQEQIKKFYRQIRNILAVVRYRYRDLEETERKEKDIDTFCLVEFYRKERR